MVSDNPNILLKFVDKIIDFAKWMWKLERSETGISNTIFMVIFFIAWSFCVFRLDKEEYVLISFLLFPILLGVSLILISKVEREERKFKFYSELYKKQK